MSAEALKNPAIQAILLAGLATAAYYAIFGFDMDATGEHPSADWTCPHGFFKGKGCMVCGN